MKYMKTYYEFINEAFDLKSFYTKEKIPNFIQENTDAKIKQWVKDVALPSDVDADKLKLWYARNFKKYCITQATKLYDEAYTYKDEKNPKFDNRIIFYQDVLNFLKGNNYETKNDMIYYQLFTFLKNFNNNASMIQHIKDYLFSNVRNAQIWKINYTSSFKEMYDTSVEWHKNLKASGSVTNESGEKLIEYPNNFYWIDLQTDSCREEADAMGHCGRSTGDTLVSLRQKKKDGSIEPFVTMAIDYDDVDIPTFGQISQCKGKNNNKPVEKYHNYIVDFILKYDINYDLENHVDFSINDIKDQKLLMRIFDEKPKLINLLSLNDENILYFINQNPKLIEDIDTNDFIFYNREKLAEVVIPDLSDYDEIKTISNNYYLLEKGLINNNDIMSKFPNVFKLKDDILYLAFKGELSDLNFIYDDKNNRNQASSSDIIKNINDDGYYLDITDFDDLYLGYLSEKSIKLIQDKIKERKLTLDEEEQNEIDEYDNWEKQLKNVNSLDDIKSAIEQAYRVAQEDADISEMYDAVLYPLLSFFEMDKLIYSEDYILIKINKNWLIAYDTYTDISEYSHMTTLTDHILSNMFEEHETHDELNSLEEKLKIDVPYYGWQGTIDKEYLEEMISDKLSEI